MMETSVIQRMYIFLLTIYLNYVASDEALALLYLRKGLHSGGSF